MTTDSHDLDLLRALDDLAADNRRLLRERTEARLEAARWRRLFQRLAAALGRARTEHLLRTGRGGGDE